MTGGIVVNGEHKFLFKVRAEYEDGNRRTYSVWANTALEARKIASRELGCGWKIIWVK